MRLATLLVSMYVLQGFAHGGRIDPSHDVLWSSQAYLHNSAGTAATVRFLGVSNSNLLARPAHDFLLPPHSTITLGQLPFLVSPASDLEQPLWMLRFDVPASVSIESVLFVGDQDVFLPFAHPYRYGKTRLPVFEALVPPGEEQIHLATFLGDPADIPSRINVAVYNGGAATAHAHIEIRRQCDDAVMEQRDVAIPPDTLLQFGGFSAQHPECEPGQPGLFGVYTAVTADQPSVSIVSAVANNYAPVTSFAVSP